MKLVVGSRIVLNDGAIFEIKGKDNLINQDYPYPFHGVCIIGSTSKGQYTSPAWTVGEGASWTEDGTYEIDVAETEFNVNIQYTKEENPEYFL